MKLKVIPVLFIIFAATAQAEEMAVYVWDPGCNHTMATSWFDVPAGQQTAAIHVDLSACTKEQVGSLLFFGNYAAKTSGRQLSSKHKVRLHLAAINEYGNKVSPMMSDSGSILADAASLGSTTYVLIAENMNRKKDIRIRLRSQLISQ